MKQVTSKKPAKYNPSKLSSQKEDSKLAFILGGVAVVAIIALIIIFVVIPGNKDKTVNAHPPVTNGVVDVVNDATIFVGAKDAPVVLDFYEDFMCPACGQFENAYGDQINQAVNNGQIAVNYHMLNFLNRSSASGDYSTRAAAAALCVADGGDVTAFSAFHGALFAPGTQPKEGAKSDLSNDDLAGIAKDHGASDTAVQCVSSGADVGRAAAAADVNTADLTAKAGKVSTPSVFNGTQQLNPSDPAWLSSIIG